jgi:hypothetical protein
VSKGEEYSPIKAVRHLDIVQATRAARPARPAHVQLILSDTCNQACNFCAYRDPSYSSSQLFYEIQPGKSGLRRDTEHPERNYNPSRMISTEKALEIIDDCADMGVSGLQFTGGGEPTVHPEFSGILHIAQMKGIAASPSGRSSRCGESSYSNSRGSASHSTPATPARTRRYATSRAGTGPRLRARSPSSVSRATKTVTAP